MEILAGAAVLAVVAADGQGSFSAALPLPEGAHELVARATDAAGNAGPDSAPARFAVDRTAPPPPVVAVPADGALLSAADTLGGAVTVAGGAEPGALVELEVTGVPQPADGESARVELREGAEVLQALAPAQGAVAFALPSLAEGSHTWSLVAVDAAGNRSAPSNAVTVVVDRTAPLAAAVASPAAGAHLAAAAVTVRGTAEPGATVLVVCDGGEAASAVAEADGAFAATLALADGARTVAVQVRDAAGNLSEATERAFTVDTLAPAALAPPQGATLPPGAIQVRGTAEPGALVTVALAGASGVATAGEDGAWSMELTLPAGTHGIHVTATDAASNVSAATEVTVVGRVDDGAGGGGGCGCRTGSGGGAPALLALAGLLALAPPPRRRGA